MHTIENGREGDEYPAFSTREAWPWTESRAQKPRGRKEHSGAGMPNTSCRHTRPSALRIRVACRVMAAGGNLGGTAGVSCAFPSRAFGLGRFFCFKAQPCGRMKRGKEADNDEDDERKDAGADGA